MESIVTPVNADRFEALLQEAGYDKNKRNFVINGFRHGFALNYEGPKEIKRYAPNLKIRVGSPTELWNKVMKEVQACRYAGPYEEVPYEYFIQLPIGLVPKDHGRKTRLIFHLSYPGVGGILVNAGIPKYLCQVKYPDFEQAIKMCINVGIGGSSGCLVYIGKSNMSMAFRQAPLRVADFCFLVLKASHPVTRKVYYFVEKCLPFGSSISCAIFQAISSAIAFIVSYKTSNPTLNYLNDYFFAAMLRAFCNWQVNTFLEVCKDISFPVSLEKTFLGTTVLVFLGLLIDTVNKWICILVDKVAKAIDMIQ